MDIIEEEPPVPPFWEDERVDYIGGWIQRILKIKEDRWIKFVEDEQNEKTLRQFFDQADKLFLMFSAVPKGGLTVTLELNVNTRGKTVYVMKKMAANIGLENYAGVLIFGELSGISFTQTSSIVEEGNPVQPRILQGITSRKMIPLQHAGYA